MKKFSLAAALPLLLLPLALAAQPSALLSIDDPQGDDVGAGALFYPGDSAYAPGDLDLRSLIAYAESGGVRFEATMRNPIRHPSTVRPPGPSSEDLSTFARRGFYAFNLDIYLDTDRVPGSGNTATLPGRGATIDASNAWDKAIVLTPRPEVARRQLIDALAASTPGGSDEAEQQVDHMVFFATDVRVRGRTVSFMVPDRVIDAQTLAHASLVAFVTAAKLSSEAEISLLGRSGVAQRSALGVAMPEAGRPRLAMGYAGGRAPATSVVDLLQPDSAQQSRQLGVGAALVGLSAENGYGTGLAKAPSVTTATAAPDPLAAGFTRTLVAYLRGESVPAVEPAAAQPPVASSLPPAVPTPPQMPKATVAPVAPAPAPAPASAPPRTRDAAFFEAQELRLRAIKRLRDADLITEQEYQQKRREVLDQM